MGLQQRINDRRKDDLTPIHERRAPEQARVPEWRRRSIEQVERVGYVAVTDLTEGRAA